MPRSVVGLLAAAGAIMAALVGLVHGDLVPAVIVSSGIGTGLAACLALPVKKNVLGMGFPGPGHPNQSLVWA